MLVHLPKQRLLKKLFKSKCSNVFIILTRAIAERQQDNSGLILVHIAVQRLFLKVL